MDGQNGPTTRNTYLEKAHARLEDWTNKVETLQRETQQTRQLKAAMRSPVESSVEPQLEELKDRVQELSMAAEENWQIVQERVEAAETKLADAYEAVSREFDVN